MHGMLFANILLQGNTKKSNVKKKSYSVGKIITMITTAISFILNDGLIYGIGFLFEILLLESAR